MIYGRDQRVGASYGPEIVKQADQAASAIAALNAPAERLALAQGDA
jgi:hypothetical protein